MVLQAYFGGELWARLGNMIEYISFPKTMMVWIRAFERTSTELHFARPVPVRVLLSPFVFSSSRNGKRHDKTLAGVKLEN